VLRLNRMIGNQAIAADQSPSIMNSASEDHRLRDYVTCQLATLQLERPAKVMNCAALAFPLTEADAGIMRELNAGDLRDRVGQIDSPSLAPANTSAWSGIVLELAIDQS